jgi:hypothetical protein
MIKKAFLSRLSKKINLLTTPMTFDRDQSVGIIAIEEFEDQMNKLALTLEGEGKRPRKVCFISEPLKNKSYPPQSFTKKDIGITGAIHSSELLYFTKQTYDFLICIDPTGDPHIKYLLSKTQARHRIGLYHTNFVSHLDMMIKPSSMDQAVSEMMRYVKMIKNDN